MADPLSCRMYESRLPETDELVMVNVRQIAEMGAYVNLLEYNGIEGMILLSELSRRRIRSIQKLIRVGRNEIVVVLRVDKEKGAFLLGRPRVCACMYRATLGVCSDRAGGAPADRPVFLSLSFPLCVLQATLTYRSAVCRPKICKSAKKSLTSPRRCVASRTRPAHIRPLTHPYMHACLYIRDCALVCCRCTASCGTWRRSRAWCWRSCMGRSHGPCTRSMAMRTTHSSWPSRTVPKRERDSERERRRTGHTETF
jgi:hypothetical protein